MNHLLLMFPIYIFPHPFYCASNLISVHYGLEPPKIQTAVLGHSLVRSLVRLHRSLVRLLRTARLARTLRCSRSLRSLPRFWESRWLFFQCFFPFSTIVIVGGCMEITICCSDQWLVHHNLRFFRDLTMFI